MEEPLNFLAHSSFEFLKDATDFIHLIPSLCIVGEFKKIK